MSLHNTYVPDSPSAVLHRSPKTPAASARGSTAHGGWHRVLIVGLLLVAMAMMVGTVGAEGSQGSFAVLNGSAVANQSTLSQAQMFSLDVPFIQNDGQQPGDVKYYANTFYGTAYVTNTDITHAVEATKDNITSGVALKEQFVTADSTVITFVPVGEDPAETQVSYFIGNDESKWQTGLPTYNLVSLGEVYPGINVKAKAHGANIEKLFTVAPGISPDAIRVKVAGADSLRIADDGSLVLSTDGGEVRLTAPKAYQDGQAVAVAYRVLGDGTYGFAIGVYDRSKALVIDPSLEYSTYLGGSGTSDYGYSITTDSTGNAYVTGYTNSADFPTTTGVFQTGNGGGSDIFVAKLNPTGTAPVYSTYLGGTGTDQGYAIEVDSSGNACITGNTRSANFPTTSGAFQTVLSGTVDAFVTTLNPTGTALVYSTYLGGSSTDYARSITLDSSGNAYITGYTRSTDFPTTSSAFQTVTGGSQDAFVSKLNPTGTALVYSTYLGGTDSDTGNGITLDSSGNAYITGRTSSANFPTTSSAFQTVTGGSQDAFVSKLNPTGTALVYSTYLGGTDSDTGNGITLDSSGNAYITGYTGSADFPTTSGAFQTSNAGGIDAFVSRLNPTGTALVYSTYLGGSGSNDYGNSLALDNTGNTYITGNTDSANFPTTSGAFQTSNAGGTDAFVSKLNPVGTGLVYSTYLGGSGSNDYGNSLALDNTGNAYITGYTDSANFPTTSGAFQTSNAGGTDAYVAKFSIGSAASAPVAGFTATPTSGSAPLNVTFTDASTGTPTSWAWDFGDGSANSTEQNPVHTYASAGTYTVTLTVTNSAGNNIAMQSNYIAVSGAVPVAAFSANVTSGARPLTAAFTDASTNTPTSWSWDFGDGSTSAEQNPVHTYTTAGNYTVALTAANANGSGNVTQTNYITVTPQCDLTISSTVITQPTTLTVFANLPNIVKINTIKNNGPDTITNIPVALYASDVSGGTVPVSTFTIASLASAATNSTIVIDPTIRPASMLGQTVTYTAVVDPDNVIAETNEANNNKASSANTIKYNGYTGKRYTNGSDMNTVATYDGKYGVVYSWGNSAAASTAGTRTSTYTSADLPVPSSATVVSARLYQGYRYGSHDPTWTMTFNGNNITDTQTAYADSVYYGSIYKEGLYAYDVTGSFNTAGNTLVENLPDNSMGVSGAYLVVVYSDPSATEKTIWINEEFDHLKSFTTGGITTVSNDQATAWANFAGVDTSRLESAKAIAICPFLQSGASATFFFDGTQYPALLSSGFLSSPNIAIKEYDVTSAMTSGANTARFQSTISGNSGADFYAANAILVMNKTTLRPTAGFMGTPASGTAPLNVTFTDQSENGPTTWLWDFGDGSTGTEQNPVHEYTAAGTYTVKLTATNGGGSDTVTKTGYITVASAVLALPDQTTAPTDPDHDGLYEDLNGNGGKDLNDAVVYFKNIDWVVANEPVSAFDYNGNGGIDLNDIILLYKEIIG